MVAKRIKKKKKAEQNKTKRKAKKKRKKQKKREKKEREKGSRRGRINKKKKKKTKKKQRQSTVPRWIVLFVITANARSLTSCGRLGKSCIFDGAFIFHCIFVFARDFPIAALIVLISMRLSARRKCVMKTNFKMDQMHPDGSRLARMDGELYQIVTNYSCTKLSTIDKYLV